MKRKYKHILFDLDHTLWDFDANCKETLLELFDHYQLANRGVNFELFFQNYIKINREVWAKYDKNRITKEEIRAYRFKRLLKIFKIKDDILAENLEKDYMNICPKKGKLIPGAIELLDFVEDRYGLALITNGFEKTQQEKVKYSGLDKYFEKMYTSESCGYKKPSIKYFNFVLKDLALKKEDALVIGDIRVQILQEQIKPVWIAFG
ncbi:MAG: HAD-IA family hydrolase [Bacteroidia bacterium]|nr:HAD-IA family hydrolase [Bacteroidia bacterium]